VIDVAAAKTFSENLKRTGCYRTDPERSPMAYFGRFNWWYHYRFARFLLEGNSRVARGEYTEPVWLGHSYDYIRIIEECGGRYEIEGLEHANKIDRPVVFVGNHMSLLEAFSLPAILLHRDRVAAVAKRSLANYPVLGPITRAVDPILVDRKNAREDLKAVLDQGKACLENGRSVVLFPQATRSVTLDPKRFNTLGVKLAKNAKAPVVPLALKTDFQKNGKWIKDLGTLDRGKTIHFKFGEPIEDVSNGRQTNERIIRFIQEALDSWK
jgi:1-acyl-sn-glycerol-3-phosphate acyltransferase